MFWASLPLTDLTGIPDTRGHPNSCDSDHDSLKLVTANHESPVADLGDGPGRAPPLFSKQTEARRAEKKFLGDCPLPPPPLSLGMDPALISSTEIQSQGPPKLFLLSLSRTWITVK